MLHYIRNADEDEDILVEIGDFQFNTRNEAHDEIAIFQYQFRKNTRYNWVTCHPEIRN